MWAPGAPGERVPKHAQVAFSREHSQSPRKNPTEELYAQTRTETLKIKTVTLGRLAQIQTRLLIVLVNGPNGLPKMVLVLVPSLVVRERRTESIK